MITKFRGDYRWLSNFYLASIVYNNIEYASSEHFYQEAKFLYEGPNQEIRDDIAIAIRTAKTPGIAKRLANKYSEYIRSDWNDVKKEVMTLALFLKFTQNLELAKMLVNTGDQEIIEGNVWHDNYWGSCGCEKCIFIVGENTLGKLLMELRSELKIRM